MNKAYIISCVIAGSMSLFLGIFVFLKNKRSIVNRLCMLANFGVSLWCWSLFGREMSFEKSYALFFIRLSYVGVISIPPIFLHFITSVIDQVNYRVILTAYAVSFIFQIFNLTPFFIKDAGPILSFRYYGIPGIIYPFFIIIFVSIIIYAHYLLIKYFKNSEGHKRNQIKYLLLASLIGFIGGGTGFLPNLNIEIFPFGFYFLSIYVLLLSYAITKYRLMDINIVFKKGTVYFIIMLFLFIPSCFIVILSEKLFFYKINYIFSAIIIFLLLCVSFLFYKIKPRTEKAIEQLLFKEKYNYRETLSEFSKAMVSILDLKALAKRIIETITKTMKVEKASFFLLNDEKAGFELAESKNVKFTSSYSLLPKGAPLPHYLQKIGEIIIKEELAKGVHLSELKEVIQQMEAIEAEVSIPLISKGHLIGILNLSHKFRKEIYSHEDLELLTTLANQAAIAIENARLYEDLKKSKSYIRRADRLASLGTLTAGLAHEIRNPLVAIKTLTQLLPERLDDEEFRNHFLNIASGEVDRISSLLNELLEFARPSDPKLEFEDINSILDGMILLISTESKKKQIQIIKQYDPELPRVKVDREQIKQVFLNILLNAIEATPENGEIRIKTRSFKKPGGEPYVQIEFTDTGCGIPSEYLEEIFNPFFTTKTTGSGLGLSISNQIVQDHRGYIVVESEEKKGSSFYVNLPVNQDYPKRRISDLENRSQKNISIFE